MELDKILDRVDIERLYQHVLNLEGPKHPIDSPQKLNKAAEYIYSQLEGYGIPVRYQEFQIEGYPDTFRNVEGCVGTEDESAVVIINHYDNVYNDPGANDNAAGVAVMLEVARLLAGEPDLPPIRFVSATLEEGNPGIESKIRKSAIELGLTDEQHRYTSYHVSKLVKKYRGLVEAAFWTGTSYSEAMTQAIEQLQDELPDALLEHFKEYKAIHGKLTAASSIGTSSRIGSSVWVDKALKAGEKIKFVICTDEIGTVSKEEYSQRWPPTLTNDMLRTYKVDNERRIGDFAFVITDAKAEKIGRTFCSYCERNVIDLAYAWLPLPVPPEGVAQEFPQALGSDHAAFWRAGISALFITDTAGLRNPYCHTQANTIDKLDFDHITKICKAIIATAVDPSLR